MDSFSDVELLCDLLEASRKRNVSVYLLLDHLNLNLFVRMWQDLKLNSKNFPKLLVRSVDGQTYCAKTGRKLTGQIAESFIITDWTEVLTGSYSFSWLSWLVHRSLVIFVKGRAITPFHQEFHRLYFSSKPVPGFVTFITVPHTLALYPTSHTPQNIKSNSSQTKAMCHGTWAEDVVNSETNAKKPLLSSQRGPELEHSKVGDPHRAGIASQNHTKPPQLHPKPMASPGTQHDVCMERPKHTAGSISTLHDAQRYVESLERNQNHLQNHSNPLGQTHISSVQSQLDSLTVSTKAEKNPGIQKSNPLDTENPITGPLRKPSGNGTSLNTPGGQWNYSLNLKAKMELPSDHFKPLSHFRNSGGYASGLETKESSLAFKRHGQPPPPLHLSTDGPGFKSTVIGHHFKLQLQTDTKPFLPGGRAMLHLQPHTSHQVKPSPKLNRVPQSHAARPRPLARTSSFDTTYRMGKMMGGQLSWGPFHSNMTLLQRSKSLTERRTSGLNPNITTI
ncbi:protein FAM83D-like [Channa argus]